MPTRTSRTVARLAAGGLVVAAGTMTGAASAAPARTLTVTNAGYSPASVSVPYGTRITWSFRQGTHSVTDATRLGLFNSRAKPPGTAYAYTFINSGTFPYRSTVGTAIRGTVVVPMTVSPATGSRTTYFAVQWGSGYTRAGYNETVELKTPGSTAWTSFVFAAPVKDATMRPADWSNRTGVYQFRAKLIKGLNHDVSSGWSPIARITVR